MGVCIFRGGCGYSTHRTERLTGDIDVWRHLLGSTSHNVEILSIQSTPRPAHDPPGSIRLPGLERSHSTAGRSRRRNSRSAAVPPSRRPGGYDSESSPGHGLAGGGWRAAGGGGMEASKSGCDCPSVRQCRLSLASPCLPPPPATRPATRHSSTSQLVSPAISSFWASSSSAPITTRCESASIRTTYRGSPKASSGPCAGRR